MESSARINESTELLNDTITCITNQMKEKYLQSKMKLK